jgi:hypothetical protein
MPPFMTFLSNKAKPTKPKNKSKSKSKSKSISVSFSPATKSKIAIFTKKRNMRHLFKRINKLQETKKKIDSFTKKRKKRISERVFRRIKSEQEKNKQEDNSCSICFDTMSNNGPLRTTPCGHKFHSECLNTWLRTKNTCPLCRAQVQAPIIVPQINPQLAQQIADANDDANELAILQMVDEYWTEQGRRPIEVELLKLCKLAVLKLSRLVRRYSRANTNAYTTAQANARTYAAAHRLDLDYYYTLEDTYNPQLPLAPPVAPPPAPIPPATAPIQPHIPITIPSPNLSLLRTAYTI